MNILVTGANGQLGNEMKCISERNKNSDFFYTDILELDITKIDEIRKFIKNHHINVIVNCAAYTNVDKAEDNLEMANLLNNLAVENLAITCKEANATLIHISTDYVFQGNNVTPLTEEQETNPLGVYGETKLAGEKSIQKTGCKYIIFRTAWLYSQFGNNFVKTIRRLTTKEKELRVVFDQIGTPTYAADLAETINHIIETDQLHKVGIYHYSNEGVCSWYDFANEITSLSTTSCRIQACHSDEFSCRAKRPKFSVLDKAKVKSTFQITIPYWRSSLIRCINNLDKK